MWFPIILAFILPLSSIAFDEDTLKFSIDYFKHRNLKFICLFSCRNDIPWIVKLSKLAFRNSIMISSVLTDGVGSDFSSVQQCLTYDLNSIGVILDRNCEGTEDVMYFASENLIYTAQHKWLIIENDNSVYGSEIDAIMTHDNGTNTVMGLLENLDISVDADIIVGVEDNPGYFTLYDVFNFGKIQGGNLIVNTIGSYDKANGFNLTVDLNEYKFYRRWDFQNWTMRTIWVATPTPKHFHPKQVSGLEPIPGAAQIIRTGGAILCIVAEVHNFNFKYTFTNEWIGGYEKNSTKVMTNSLYFREQDISPVIRHVTSMLTRTDALVTTVAFIETRYFYRIPTTGPGKYENQFLTPLNPTAWWGVIGISLLCALVLLLSSRLEERPSWAQYAVFSVIASICQQFYEDTDDRINARNSTARKITILVTGLSCVLIFNYYTSSVVSWLLNGPPPSINSLRDLLESPLELIFEDTAYTRPWLQMPTYYFNKRNAQVEDEMRIKKVFNKKKNAPLLVPLVEGMKMVQRGGYAYHTEPNTAYSLISRTFDQTELCELGSLQSVEKTKLSPCLTKGSPYKEFMTWSLMQLTERGFVSCVQARITSIEAKCEGISPRALSLGGASPVFILLAGGYLLGTMIMLCERFLYKMRNTYSLS